MKQHGPWKVMSSEVKYKNPWIEVREDAVIRPDGKPGIYGVINFSKGIGVSVLALDDDGFVYLTREFKYASGKEHVEAASGGLHGEETPLKAAKRELKEELGIQAAEWIPFGVVEPFTGIFKHVVYLFIARNLTFANHEREGTELTMQMAKMKFEDAVEKVMLGEITNGPTCLLLLKANDYLKRKK